MYGERLGDGVEYHLMSPTHQRWMRPGRVTRVTRVTRLPRFPLVPGVTGVE